MYRLLDRYGQTNDQNESRSFYRRCVVTNCVSDKVIAMTNVIATKRPKVAEVIDGGSLIDVVDW